MCVDLAGTEKRKSDSRVVQKVAKGLIEDENAAAILLGLREESDRLTADLTKMEKQNKVIELFHSQSGSSNENLEKLTEILSAEREYQTRTPY